LEQNKPNPESLYVNSGSKMIIMMIKRDMNVKGNYRGVESVGGGEQSVLHVYI
jgi:hypothetical protein